MPVENPAEMGESSTWYLVLGIWLFRLCSVFCAAFRQHLD
jgi:hypothetical protein